MMVAIQNSLFDEVLNIDRFDIDAVLFSALALASKHSVLVYLLKGHVFRLGSSLVSCLSTGGPTTELLLALCGRVWRAY